MTYDEMIRDRVRRVLIQCRKEKDISQAELGKVIGKSKTAIASWEQGLSMPDIATLYKLAQFYNKSLEYMYGEEGKEVII